MEPGASRDDTALCRDFLIEHKGFTPVRGDHAPCLFDEHCPCGKVPVGLVGQRNNFV